VRRGQRGFTVVELSISLLILLLALALAADLFLETSKLLAYTSGEALDAPVPLVIARIRADVQGSVGVVPVLTEDGALEAILVQELDRRIVYEKRGDALYRRIVPASGGPPSEPQLLWPAVSGWSCRIVGANLVHLEVTYRRRAVPRSPLPTLDRGPATEELTQKMFLLPRGAGLGETW
jgi:prepilin-type N-terminal cleavage/methylation domain-containing protein